MNDLNFDTPIVIMFFNRPDTLTQVFEAVKNVKPRNLFLIQDGPRLGNDNDIYQINSCREIVDDIDWECTVHRNYSETNMGLAARIISGLSWVFEHVDQSIILEDDCVPNSSFFSFCQLMLEKYKKDLRVGIISGFNYFNEYDFGGYSYGFVKSGGIWGWATWKNRWEKFDFEMSKINNDYVKKLIKHDIGSLKIANQRMKNWRDWRNKIITNQSTSWDFSWGFTRHVNSWLSIVPKSSLIMNIGLGSEATHTKHLKKNAKYNPFFRRTKELEKPLKIPDFVLADRQYDLAYYKLIYKSKIGNIFRKTLRFFLRESNTQSKIKY